MLSQSFISNAAWGLYSGRWVKTFPRLTRGRRMQNAHPMGEDLICFLCQSDGPRTDDLPRSARPLFSGERLHGFCSTAYDIKPYRAQRNHEAQTSRRALVPPAAGSSKGLDSSNAAPHQGVASPEAPFRTASRRLPHPGPVHEFHKLTMQQPCTSASVA